MLHNINLCVEKINLCVSSFEQIFKIVEASTHMEWECYSNDSMKGSFKPWKENHINVQEYSTVWTKSTTSVNMTIHSGADPAKNLTALRPDVSRFERGLGVICSLLDRDRSKRFKGYAPRPLPYCRVLETPLYPQIIALSHFKLNISSKIWLVS